MSIKSIDTHCHPYMSQYDADREAVLQRALDAGIGMICVGVDLESSREAIAMTKQYENIWASVGLHPNDNLDEQYDQSAYIELAKHPKVVAIGEVGLDYYRTTDTTKKEFQKKRFEEQLRLAIEVDKPLIIHCRDAHQDMIPLLQTQQGKLRGVIHSFTGTYEDARQYIAQGFYIGLNGIITFASQYNETVQNIPLDKILLETDAPFLTPVPYRGQRNEPSYVLEVAKKIAELRGSTLEQVLEQTTHNARNLFGLV